MATATTYSTLISDVQGYLDRGQSVDPTVFDQLPRLINLAERNIARMIKPQFFDVAMTSAMTSGVGVISKPDRWRQTISINVGADVGSNVRSFLYPRSYEYCRYYWPDDSLTGKPKFYADYDTEHWLVVPTPPAALPFEVLYYELPPLLDVGNQTNKMTELCPQLLLYRVLLECAPFIKNDDRIPTWQRYHDEALAAINNEDIEKMVDRSVTRDSA